MTGGGLFSMHLAVNDNACRHVIAPLVHYGACAHYNAYRRIEDKIFSHRHFDQTKCVEKSVLPLNGIEKILTLKTLKAPTKLVLVILRKFLIFVRIS